MDRNIILEMAKAMTRELFISDERYTLEGNCTSNNGLINDNNCNNCERCWTDVIKDIQFKGDEDIPKQNNKLKIKEMAKIMTRAKFLEEVDKNEGLSNECIKYTDIDVPKEMFREFNCCPDANCKKCFEIAIKDILFVGDKIVNKCGSNFSNGKNIVTVTKIEKSTFGDYDLIWFDIDSWIYRENIKLYNEGAELKSKLKYIFNIDEFKKNDIAIKCKSRDQADELFKILIINGIQNWNNGNNLKDNTMFHMSNDGDESKLFYNYESEDKGLDWGMSKSWYKNNGFKIIKFKNIDFSNVWNKESIQASGLHKIEKIEELKQVTICKVSFVTDTDKLKDFILSIDSRFLNNPKEGDIIECKVGLEDTWNYAKVKSVVQIDLTEDEIGKYKVCRKLS